MSDSPDLAAITEMQQKVWSEGDFAMVANLVYFASENLAEALDIVPGERCLDVACGSGNLAIAMARRAWGNTVGADFVPALLERGRERADAERLEIEFVEADAQKLPFEEASFDVVASGGRIGMANWTPDGGVGAMFMTIAKHTGGPPAGVMPPALWGVEERVRELFGDGVSDLRFEKKKSRQAFRSVDQYLEFFRAYFGPIKTAFEKVGPEGEAALTADLRAYLEEFNTAGERALVIEPDYLEIVATRA
jgi:SAM-dependent methyltransferase